MISHPSPPQQAEHIRHQQLTPESPRPQTVPAPSNIPILVLEKQMDPVFHDADANNHSADDQANHPFNVATHASSTHAPTQPRPASANAQQDSFSHDNHAAYPYAHDSAYPAGSVDVQALLDSLTSAATNPSSGQHAAPSMSPQSAHAQSAAAPSLPTAASNLPARPPAQDKPATHPNYNPNDDIRSYHPHSQKPATAQQRTTAQLPPLNLAAQQFSAAPRPAQSPTTPGAVQRQPVPRSETPDDEDIRWGPEVNKLYEDFLDQERKFVTEGQWDQFPMGSRLFIGNLPTEKVTKRDIFHRFYRHGRLAQISIKQAYGFVQFLDSESCRRALDTEQGQAVRGRKMHLEISKPQRNTKKAEPQPTVPRRRSRSPDYTRGGTGPTRDARYAANKNSMSPRDRDRRFRDRDDYRPPRSPSPRGRGMRSRDRSRERYDARHRSRSRTPPRRYRSPSPRRDYIDDLGLPRRLPHEVPDVQVLVLNEGIPRDFIRYVEDTFRSHSLRINVLIMSPRLSEPAVVRRQIIEGVLAIVRIDMAALSKSKVNVQIFDRRGGANNVQFNEYADLDLVTAAMLINNAKQTNSQPVQPPAPAYGYNPQYSQPASNPFPSAPTAHPNNMSNLISSLDPNTLSQLLGAMSGNNAPQMPQPASGINADLARLLAQVSSPAQTPGFSTSNQQQVPQLGNQYSALASIFGAQASASTPQTQTAAQPAGAPDMNEIMAQLAKYQR